jgi:hypothetical protein
MNAQHIDWDDHRHEHQLHAVCLTAACTTSAAGAFNLPVTARCESALTVVAKMACAVVGDSGVVALLLLGPFRDLPACASSTRLDTCGTSNQQVQKQVDVGGCAFVTSASTACHLMLPQTVRKMAKTLLNAWVGLQTAQNQGTPRGPMVPAMAQLSCAVTPSRSVYAVPKYDLS